MNRESVLRAELRRLMEEVADAKTTSEIRALKRLMADVQLRLKKLKGDEHAKKASDGKL